MTGAAIRDGDDDQKASLKAKEMSVVDDMINGEDLSSSSTDILVKPMEGINGSDPPPFLTKTFEMVEDPETDPIVSWSIHRNSFIVWDSHKFSENLLPKYFKHKNFSSFIRQLNTYVSHFNLTPIFSLNFAVLFKKTIIQISGFSSGV